MKVTLKYLAATALAVSAASAFSCDSTIAVPWAGTGGGVDDCNGDAACEAQVLAGECAAIASIDDTQDCVTKRKAKRDGSVECATDEMCYSGPDSVFCIVLATGEYHDNLGGTGNAGTGVYTSANGELVTVQGTATGSATGAASTKTSHATTGTASATAGSGASSTRAASSTGTASTAAAAASSASTSASSGSSASQASAAAQTSSPANAGAKAQNVLMALAPVPLLVAFL